MEYSFMDFVLSPARSISTYTYMQCAWWPHSRTHHVDLPMFRLVLGRMRVICTFQFCYKFVIDNTASFIRLWSCYCHHYMTHTCAQSNEKACVKNRVPISGDRLLLFFNLTIEAHLIKWTCVCVLRLYLHAKCVPNVYIDCVKTLFRCIVNFFFIQFWFSWSSSFQCYISAFL